MRKDITVAAEEDLPAARTKRAVCASKDPCLPLCTAAKPVHAPVAVNPKELNKILNSKTGHNTIFNLSVGGKEKSR